jgi:hypothetical protein
MTERQLAVLTGSAAVLFPALHTLSDSSGTEERRVLATPALDQLCGFRRHSVCAVWIPCRSRHAWVSTFAKRSTSRRTRRNPTHHQ